MKTNNIEHYLSLPYTIVLKKDDEGDFVARILRHREVFRLVGLEQVDGAPEGDPGGIHIVENLRFGGIPQFLVAADIHLRTRFLALVAVENSQRN